MGDIQNLSGPKALEKIKDLAKDKTTMFCTFEDEQMVTRPMHTQGIDEDGTFWFFSEKDPILNPKKTPPASNDGRKSKPKKTKLIVYVDFILLIVNPLKSERESL